MPIDPNETDLTLEVELDLPLDPADVARFHAHVAGGCDEHDAATRTAQEMLGGNGAIVQGADAVKS